MKSIFWSNTLLFKFCKLISRNIFKQVWILVFVHHSLVRKMKKLLSRKKFCQINDLVISLVKPLLSRNFCQKIIRENCRNFHTACIICTFYKEMEIKIVKSIWRIWNLDESISRNFFARKLQHSITLWCVCWKTRHILS